jgi:hypothetical protein
MYTCYLSEDAGPDFCLFMFGIVSCMSNEWDVHSSMVPPQQLYVFIYFGLELSCSGAMLTLWSYLIGYLNSFLSMYVSLPPSLLTPSFIFTSPTINQTQLL